MNERNSNSDLPSLEPDGASKAVPAKAEPWGLWATAGFSFLIMLAFIFIQGLVLVGFVVAAKVRQPELEIESLAQTMETDGLLLSLATCASTPVCVGLTLLVALARKGVPLKEYLALRRICRKGLSRWLMVLVAFAMASDGLSLVLGRPVVPEFMVEAYQTARFTPLIWVTLIVAAPLFEETFFRGFLFTGLYHSRLGPVGAVLVSALAWAMIHLQYDLYGIGSIFAGGLLLGYARLRSGSILPCLAMHALMNLIATLEVAVFLRWNAP